MHLGVLKVGLLWLAKPEVFCQRIIFKKNGWKIKYHPTLTTPIVFSNCYLRLVIYFIRIIMYISQYVLPYCLNFLSSILGRLSISSEETCLMRDPVLVFFHRRLFSKLLFTMLNGCLGPKTNCAADALSVIWYVALIANCIAWSCSLMRNLVVVGSSTVILIWSILAIGGFIPIPHWLEGFKLL